MLLKLLFPVGTHSHLFSNYCINLPGHIFGSCYHISVKSATQAYSPRQSTIPSLSQKSTCHGYCFSCPMVMLLRVALCNVHGCFELLSAISVTRNADVLINPGTSQHLKACWVTNCNQEPMAIFQQWLQGVHLVFFRISPPMLLSLWLPSFILPVPYGSSAVMQHFSWVCLRMKNGPSWLPQAISALPVRKFLHPSHMTTSPGFPVIDQQL